MKLKASLWNKTNISRCLMLLLFRWLICSVQTQYIPRIYQEHTAGYIPGKFIWCDILTKEYAVTCILIDNIDKSLYRAKIDQPFQTNRFVSLVKLMPWQYDSAVHPVYLVKTRKRIVISTLCSCQIEPFREQKEDPHLSRYPKIQDVNSSVGSLDLLSRGATYPETSASSLQLRDQRSKHLHHD